ncbi:acetate uptake transporter [Acholeplasma granularum]|uniref:acetate uptake transporter n=1 Tax=Acholeplasma granularum TaxID=264635 RepID=UPI0004B8F317|nr:GPR1/FUN34/YaaH family transporter [Acholeplasma granularum]
MTKKMNPGPLGLLGFGMTTILLNLHNAGITELTLVIIAMGIALGGLAQIVAGILEFKNNNNFGGTAFTAYGFFWLSLVIIWLYPSEYPALTADLTSMGFYLLLWAIFTTFMAVGTITHNTITKLVFGSLALLFYLLALGDFTGISFITMVAGYVGIITGLFAMYSAVGQIVNEELGKKVFPL